jgi:23S rRNA (uracil1939-C5)-methyltransferase
MSWLSDPLFWMKMMSDQSEVVRFSGFAYGGEAFGRLADGRAVFTPFVMPGELARVQVVEDKRGFARARLVEVIEPSPERISPRCTHFAVCGGCHYQHIPYVLQLSAKQAIVRDQLERIGGLTAPNVLSAVASPREYYYRNHVQFHLNPEGKLGFHIWHSDEVFAARECHLPEEALNGVWPQLDFEALPELERIGLRLGIDEDVQLILESDSLETPELSIEDLDISATHLSPAGLLTLAGSPVVHIDVLGRVFEVSAGSFFQVNTAMAAAMAQHVLVTLPALQPLGSETLLVDAYCGVGLFSAFLAPHVGRLIGIESSPSACEDFTVNLDEFDHVELYEARVEDVLPGLEIHPQIILLDPPRAGVDRKALDAILLMAPRVIVYVSCDPSTLARDAKRLQAAGYRLHQVTPFDLFPQTFHIESISFWIK